MRIRLKRLDRADQDHELVFGVLSLTLLFALSFLALKFPAYVPGCALYDSTGIPCPACGSFRCGEALLAGRFGDAWSVQPLAVILSVCGLLYAAYSWITVLFRLPRVRVEMTRREKGLVALLAVAVLLVNWVYLVLRESV